MRDYESKTNPVVYTISHEREPQDPTYTPFTTSHPGDCLVRKKGRADLKPSDHVRATPYHAFDVRIQPLIFTLEKRGPGGVSHYYDGSGTLQTVNWEGYKKAHGKMAIEPRTMSYMGIDSTTFAPIVEDNIQNRAINKALKKMKNQQAELGVALGELSEVKTMMSARLAQLLRLFLMVLKRDFSGIRKHWKQLPRIPRTRSATLDASRLWLEIQLGWLPLMRELFGLHQAALSALDRLDEEGLVRVTAVETGRNVPWFHYNHSFEGSSEQGCQVGLVGKIESSYVHALKTLGLENPASIAWDLLPLSFTVNWFVQVGGFLNLLSASAGLEFVSGYKTTWSRGRGVVERQFYPDGSSGWEGSFPKWQVDVFTMQRELFSEFPTARITLGSGLDSWKSLTALALLRVRDLDS